MIRKFLLISLVCMGVVYWIIASLLIYQTAQKEAPTNADYVMVLGAKVNGETMSLSLYNRAKEALDYANRNPNTMIITTGGQGPGEDITEAEAVARFLIDHGIKEERIIKEDHSTSTYENFLFTKQLIRVEDKTVVVVSNDFHLYRSSVIAKRQGFTMFPLAAETPNVVKVQAYVREYAAIIKTWLVDK
ncbi:YdcF family protein [Bacillus sp. CGMCC 1.16541]|uniref:YdcF family protein n=1 Tax=Bacillus sp. CGMCC 1.16541 TaxID=2185143 RepID=UPI001EF66650|nr:YdcF family protein [Bacillus sp. CGMCC 1.16541]